MSFRTIYEAEGTVTEEELTVEDGGSALIYEGGVIEKGEDDCLFARIQSWDEYGGHPSMYGLVGKRVRITIEVED